MRKLILRMQTSLDGFVAGPNGEMDWFDTSGGEQWAELFDALKTVDTIVMGRGMYPEYAEYWSGALTNPDAEKSHVRYAQLAETIPHVVFSRRLKRADWGDTRIARGDVAREIRALKRKRGKNMLAYGGARFASSLIDAGLVDEYELIVNPVLLGGGKWLFRNAKHRRGLELTREKTFASGAVLLRYRNA